MTGILKHHKTVKVVYVDWYLPGSDPVEGELIRQLVEEMADTKIYVLSTSVDEKEIDEAREAGAHGWINKAKMIKSLAEIHDDNRALDSEFKIWN